MGHFKLRQNHPALTAWPYRVKKTQQRFTEECLVATQEFNIVYTQGKHITTYEMAKQYCTMDYEYSL